MKGEASSQKHPRWLGWQESALHAGLCNSARAATHAAPPRCSLGEGSERSPLLPGDRVFVSVKSCVLTRMLRRVFRI